MSDGVKAVVTFAGVIDCPRDMWCIVVDGKLHYVTKMIISHVGDSTAPRSEQSVEAYGYPAGTSEPSVLFSASSAMLILAIMTAPGEVLKAMNFAEAQIGASRVP